MKEYTVKELDDGRTYHYDKNGNEIYCKFSSGYEYWQDFDKNGNLIYYKYCDGFEIWPEYDENNNLIHYKDSDGFESWREYDENNNEIYYRNSDGYEYWYIDGEKVTKEEWEKHYKKNVIILNGKEYPISSETLQSFKELVKDIS